MRKLIRSPLVGGVLLIAGTTLGVGMLALPVVTSFGGFFPSTLLIFLIWLLMLFSAFCFLDANLSIKGENNMVTMAEKTLGSWGKLVSWVVYLLLLYSLTAAFIAGCSPLFIDAIKQLTGYTLSEYLAPFALPVIFGGFIYFGTRGVDRINRVLMLGLLLAFFLLIFFIPSQVHLENLIYVDFPAITLAIPVVITAFGYQIIIPSLTTYMKRDVKQIRLAIIIGSIIPICVYLLWQGLILGAVPLPMLAEAYEQGASATDPLSIVLSNPWIAMSAKLFSFFAITTSFIGVTLSLSDFLSDGFKIKKTVSGRLVAIALTFIPPLFFVFTYQKGFYIALQYAGAFVAILLVFLPAAMVWNLKKYKSSGKRLLLLIMMFAGVVIVVLDILEEQGILKSRVLHKQLEKSVSDSVSFSPDLDPALPNSRVFKQLVYGEYIEK